MECKDIELLVSDYLENNLTKDERKEFEKHLKVCNKCREFVNEFQDMTYELQELKREVSFIQKNKLYVIFDNNFEEQEKTNYGFLKWVGLVAATIILFFNLFYFTNIVPSMNKKTHLIVSKIEKTVIKTFSYIKMLTNPEDFAYMLSKKDENKESNKKKIGGKNG